jgi:GntR family transcriptional regulator
VLGTGRVLQVRRLNLADGAPFARVTVWCPERLGSSLSRDDVERSPFYELLPVEIGGATQTIGASAASDDDAEALGVPIGSPVLVCRRVTADVDGDPVLVSEHVFAAHRTEFVVELPRADESIAPSGVRLT